MDEYEQIGNSNISENMSRLLVDDLETGNYDLFEDDLSINIEITNTSDSGQHIIVNTENKAKTERILTTIQVQPTHLERELPIISAAQHELGVTVRRVKLLIGIPVCLRLKKVVDSEVMIR